MLATRYYRFSAVNHMKHRTRHHHLGVSFRTTGEHVAMTQMNMRKIRATDSMHWRFEQQYFMAVEPPNAYTERHFVLREPPSSYNKPDDRDHFNKDHESGYDFIDPMQVVIRLKPLAIRSRYSADQHSRSR